MKGSTLEEIAKKCRHLSQTLLETYETLQGNCALREKSSNFGESDSEANAKQEQSIAVSFGQRKDLEVCGNGTGYLK